MTQTLAGTFTGNVTLASNPVSIVSAAAISGTSVTAISVYGPAGTNQSAINQGTISDAGAGNTGVSLASAGTITNSASGPITGYGLVGAYRGALVSGGAPAVSNAGRIGANLRYGSSVATLAIPGTYSTANVLLASDGTGITVQTASALRSTRPASSPPPKPSPPAR